jgi:prepilin-type N-terminal cleavage/methylation domain-containing protein
VTASPLKSNAGFTLVEVLIGMSLSLMLMGAVLSSYVFLGRNFTRALGITSANQPTLEAQSRRTLTYFTQDVRMASGVDTTAVAPKVAPSNSGVTLILPSSTGSPKCVTYFFNDTSAPVTLTTFTVPAKALIRIDVSANTSQVLHTGHLNPDTYFYFRYYDASGQPYDNSTPPYTTSTSYLSSIKQVSIAFSAQGGDSSNGTLTPVFLSASPRLILRNTQLLP